MTVIILAFWLLTSSIFCSFTHAATVINASVIPFEQQTYRFDRENLCRLLAHESLILNNARHHLLILDGGFGKFKYNWNGQDYEVLDLNRYTAAIDLTRNFTTVDLPTFTLQHAKLLPRRGGAPVLNHFGMWSDSTQNAIYIQGGHFYSFPPWNESNYHVPKPEIPAYSLWRFDVVTEEWKDVTGETEGVGEAVRTFGGAVCSVPRLNRSFWLGGITDRYTSATSPIDVFSPQTQFLTYDHRDGSLTSEAYYAPGATEGYWHGTLEHLPVGAGSGFLISLMSQKAKVDEYPDLTPENNETGQNVTFSGVMLYDIDNKVWYNQSTAVLLGEEPPYRTRFCSAVAHQEGSKTWELWIFGGQGLDLNQTTGTGDVWVLSMPSFIWTRISLVPANSNRDIRSHTCHAIGSQLLIIGGYPLGQRVDPNVPCDVEFVKIIDMNTGTWQPKFSTKTAYKIHPDVAARAALPRPYAGDWADPVVEAAFSYASPTPTPSVTPSNPPTPTSTPPSSGLRPGAVAGIVIGALAGVTALVAALVLAWRWRRRQEQREEKREEKRRKELMEEIMAGLRGPEVVQPPSQSQPEPELRHQRSLPTVSELKGSLVV